ELAAKHMVRIEVLAGPHVLFSERNEAGFGSSASPGEYPTLLNPDPVDDDSLLELIRQIQAGIRVEENFEKLFRRFRPLVHSRFLHKGFSVEESKDLTQEVFFRVFKGIDTFRGESRFERWLWEIADNIYLNELRRRKAEKRHAIEQSLDAKAESDDGSSPAMEIAAPDLSPEERVLQQQGLAV